MVLNVYKEGLPNRLRLTRRPSPGHSRKEREWTVSYSRYLERIKSDTPLSRFTTLTAHLYRQKYRFSLRLDCGISIADI
jgi:hypothetical protein